MVGPRPLTDGVPSPLQSERQARRHEVRPGITGWAQINGRNQISWPERLEMDVWYVENRSFLLDSRILLMTVLRVLRREGIAPENATVMKRFEGEE
jgi:sugar transferase EpsL